MEAATQLSLLLPAPLLVLAYMLSKMKIPAGDGIAAAGVFSLAAAFLEHIVALRLASFAGISIEVMRNFTLGAGALAVVVLGMRERGSTGAAMALTGYAIGLALGMGDSMNRIAAMAIGLLNIELGVIVSVFQGLLASTIAYITAPILGGAVPIILIYLATSVTAFVDSSISALNRAVYRTLLALTEKPVWTLLIGFPATTFLTTIPAAIWAVSLIVLANAVNALWLAIGANIAKGTVWVALGNSLSGLGAAILLTTVLGDVRKIAYNAFKSLGGRPSLGVMAVIVASIIVAAILMTALNPLVALAVGAYYVAMILSIAGFASMPRPPRRIRMLDAAADTLYVLSMAYHLSLILDKVIETIKAIIDNIRGSLP